MSPLLYQNLSRLSGVVPAAVLTQLRERYDTNVRKSLVLARELFRVLDCIEALGVEAIPYKGVVLAETFYGDMALRQSGDMDLFVRARDVVRHALSASGRARGNSATVGANLHAARLTLARKLGIMLCLSKRPPTDFFSPALRCAHRPVLH